MTKKYAIIETVSKFKHTYAFEVPDGVEDPYDYVKHFVETESIELTQLHMGEYVVGALFESEEEVVNRAKKENKYLTYNNIIENLINVPKDVLT